MFPSHLSSLTALRRAADLSFPGMSYDWDSPEMDAWRTHKDAYEAALLAHPGAKAMIKAVRSHPLVGDGSCSSIDECYSAPDLVEMLLEDGATTPAEAVKAALESEGIYLEQATNSRWGADDDPELAALEEFKKVRKDGSV